MKSLSWVEIAQYPSPERLDVLSKYLSDRKIENKIEYIQADSSNLSEVLKLNLQKFDAIRIGRGVGDCVHSHFNNNSFFVQRVGTADCALKINGQWELRCALHEALTQICGQVGKRFDLDSHVLVVGTGAVARAAIAALTRAGFSKFGVSDQKIEKVIKFCDQMKNVFFNTEFKPIPKDEIILLPGIYGVLVNTTPLQEGNEILDELSYFNFFTKNAIVFDFTLKPIKTPLLIEAQDIGGFPVFGFETAALADAIWVNWLLGSTVDMSGYRTLLESELAKS